MNGIVEVNDQKCVTGGKNFSKGSILQESFGLRLFTAVSLPFVYHLVMAFVLAFSESLTGKLWLGFFLNALLCSFVLLNVWKFQGFVAGKKSFKQVISSVVLAVILAVVTNVLFSYLIDAKQSLAYEILKEKDLLQHVFIILGVAIAVPIVEELLFRKVLFGQLIVVMNPWLAAIVSSIYFSAWHFQFDFFFPLFFLGLIFNWVYMRTGKIWTAMFLHSLNNFTSLMMIYFNS